MRIIQIVQKPQLRGAEIFACQLSNHLVDLGHELLVVSIFQGDATLPFRGKVIKMERPINKRFFDPLGWKKLNVIVREFEPDIIQINAADTLKFTVSSKLLYSWNSNLVYRNANKMGDFINSRIKWNLNKFLLSKVSFIISVSNECKKDLIKTFNYPRKKVETIEIGVEEVKLGAAIPRDLENIFEKGPVLVHIGGFVPEKNHEGLIKIFSRILKLYPESQLVLIGKGGLLPIIDQQVENSGIASNIHFLNYRNDVLDILSHSTAFVMPSLIEGLPGVILEAMYCNTPVIAYDVGGIREVVISGKTGWLVPKNDEACFKNCLTEVLSGGEEVEQRVNRAKEMILKRFLNKSIAERFQSSYKNLLNN